MTTYANRSNLELIDTYYESWRNDPSSVDASWRSFFEGFELAANGGRTGVTASAVVDGHKQSQVDSLIYGYRTLGHAQADIDPLSDKPPPDPRLALGEFDLTEADLESVFDSGHYLGGGPMRLSTIIEGLKATYCGKLGIEYIHMQDTKARRWIQNRLEPIRSTPDYPAEKQIRILRKIYAAETFESFLQTRHTGQKRFSLEGGETLIPALDALIEHCALLGPKEIVLGMAHRGRLNVLANTIKKSYEFIFREFEENYIADTVAGDGDVKYHLGYESTIQSKLGPEVDICLAANPSHLEAVDPVVQGKTRARQRLRGDLDRKLVIPVLIHGDAAFAGQGIVAEVFNFSQLPGYRTGGTIHIVVNNQIGFTTTPTEARSTHYCTDIAKMIEAPIFHVNGDSPLHVVLAVEAALEFRQKFQRDVVIDMVCYRKHGHNETDEPMFTQPILYQKIAKHPPISQIMTAQLVESGTMTQEEVKAIEEEYRESLEAALARAKKAQEEANQKVNPFEGSTATFQPPYSFEPVKTRVALDLLEKVTRGLTRIPEGFKINPKLKRFLKNRLDGFENRTPIDWAFGEALAFGTLLVEGTPIRLSGQDSERGTFSQRHAALHDIETRERYVPLLHLDSQQARFCVYNSLLSEAAVLGFDFGYSLDYPQMLCLWEAQFGDFANGAQVVIDQFITCSESKWQRVSGIVLLLPHGYEGQGPEHSSARLERFLQACAENNIQVCNPTTPAQMYHLLRRQMKRSFRKPLIVMAPKSLLRHKDAVSSWDELTDGSFCDILVDPNAPKKARRVILCSGKVYYDLNAYRTENKINDTAIIRVEQLYPLNKEALKQAVHAHRQATSWIWCQEESKNMGAWTYIQPELMDLFQRDFTYAGRDRSASTAVGSLAHHKYELAELLKAAFN
ncbi:MAG: 2-oxoglutarate dehydrogenase E1 component [Opitutaceae bacterium]